VEMTIEQKRALALARARARAAATVGAGSPVQQNAPQEVSQPFQRATEAALPLLGGSALQAGVGDAAIKAALGVKQFFGGLSDDDKLALKEMEKENAADPEGFKRGAGNVLGNAAMMAVPGAALSKATAGLKAVQAMGAAAPYAATALAGGAQEFLTAPGEGDTFGEQMGSKAKQAAVAAVTGPLLQKTMGLIAQPFKAKVEAAKLFEQGVNPTLQQGAAGRFGRFIGGLTSGATDVRKRQETEVIDALAHRATEGNVQVANGTGREYLDAVKHYVGDQYDTLFKGKRFPISKDTRAEIAEVASKLNKQGQFVEESGKAGRAVGNIMGDSPTNINIGHAKMRDDYLGPLARAAYGEDGEVRRRILAARDELIDRARTTRLTPAEQQRLNQIDSLNFDKSRLREAIGDRGEEMGVKMSRLTSAYGKMTDAAAKIGNTTEAELIGPAARVLGNTPRQDEARTALITAGRITGIGGLAALGGASAGAMAIPVAGMYGLSAIGQSKAGAKALLGQTDKQKALAEMLRKYQSGFAPAGVIATDEGNY
jgi:hypothetical protein